MLPASRTGARGNQTGAPDVARSRSRSRTAVTALSLPTASSRPDNHRAGMTVASSVPQTGASLLAGMPPAEQAAILQAAKEQFISELNADEGHMDDDEESYDDDNDEEQYESKLLADAFAPVAQALARLEAAVAVRADQQVPLPPIPRPIPLRGIEIVTLDIRRSQANIDRARLAGNIAVVQIEQNFLAFFQIEFAALRERLQGSRQRY
jgi:hypothetical protein